MKLYTIDTGFFKLDGGAMYGVVPKTIWQKLNPPDNNNLCTWAMRCLLIEDSKRLILIDCGMGDKQSAKFFSYYEPHGEENLIKSLTKYGFHIDDITDVVLSHLHFDHCGGAISIRNDRYVPTFQNALYWSHEKHWDWAMNPNAREKASFLAENILPIKESGQLKFLEEGLNPELSEIIDIRCFSGHTESMMVPIINLPDKKIAYMADLLPSHTHVPLPYVMAYDTRPLLTLSEKEHFFKYCIMNNIEFYLEHDKDFSSCIVDYQQDSNKIVVVDTFTI